MKARTVSEILLWADGLNPDNELSNPPMAIAGALLEIAAQLSEANELARLRLQLDMADSVSDLETYKRIRKEVESWE